MVQGLGSMVYGSGFKPWFRVWDVGFGVLTISTYSDDNKHMSGSRITSSSSPFASPMFEGLGFGGGGADNKYAQ